MRPQTAAQDRELKIVAIADGARDNRTCLESLTPDIRLIDVWQACRALKEAADAADGAESARSTAGFDTHKAILTDDPQGVFTVRARLKSERVNSVWAQRTYRRRYTHARLSANDNRTPLARVA